MLNKQWERLLRWAYRPVVRRALSRSLLGREIARGDPEMGRFLKSDVIAVHQDLWRNLDRIDLQAAFDALPNFGNRHNVFLAAVTLAGYRALRVRGIDKEHAVDLLGDVGWQLYMMLASLPRTIGKVFVRDPQKRIEYILRALMVFPFSAPGRPGYEVRAWADDDGFHTHWTCCPPFEFAERLSVLSGDKGELDAFRLTWCTYDWGLTYALLDGAFGVAGRYERPHTLSYGDSVCDMCWSASSRRSDKKTGGHRLSARAAE